GILRPARAAATGQAVSYTDTSSCATATVFLGTARRPTIPERHCQLVGSPHCVSELLHGRINSCHPVQESSLNPRVSITRTVSESSVLSRSAKPPDRDSEQS